jgi:hypothetical protein
MTKEKLIKKINEILKTDFDLGFLLELKKEDIERLVACIRDRLDR